jgi:hypothetical protein
MKTLNLEQMENVQAGKMACWAALALYGAAFIGLCGATGGLFIVVGFASLGGSVYEAIESC